jgi:hypothetical protein
MRQVHLDMIDVRGVVPEPNDNISPVWRGEEEVLPPDPIASERPVLYPTEQRQELVNVLDLLPRTRLEGWDGKPLDLP